MISNFDRMKKAFYNIVDGSCYRLFEFFSLLFNFHFGISRITFLICLCSLAPFLDFHTYFFILLAVYMVHFLGFSVLMSLYYVVFTSLAHVHASEVILIHVLEIWIHHMWSGGLIPEDGIKWICPDLVIKGILLRFSLCQFNAVQPI